MKSPKELRIFTDGASRGNPGKAAIGFVIEDGKGKIIGQHSERIGIATNNVAEYTAVIKALKYAAAKYSSDEVSCFSDSEFMVDQLTGKDKVKKKHIKQLFIRVKDLEKNFQNVTYYWLPRVDPRISRVDKMVNEELDRPG